MSTAKKLEASPTPALVARISTAPAVVRGWCIEGEALINRVLAWKRSEAGKLSPDPTRVWNDLSHWHEGWGGVLPWVPETRDRRRIAANLVGLLRAVENLEAFRGQPPRKPTGGVDYNSREVVEAGLTASVGVPWREVVDTISRIALSRVGTGVEHSDPTAAEVVIDRGQRTATVLGRPLNLKPRAIEVLAALATEPNRWVCQSDIVEYAWGKVVGPRDQVRKQVGAIRAEIARLVDGQRDHAVRVKGMIREAAASDGEYQRDLPRLDQMSSAQLANVLIKTKSRTGYRLTVEPKLVLVVGDK